MEAKSRVVVTGALGLAVAIAAFWFLFVRADDAPVHAAPPAETPAPAEAATLVAESRATSEQTATEDAPTPAPERTAVPDASPKNAILRGRCVDADGQPLAGCKVDFDGWTGNRDPMDQWLIDHGEKPAWTDPPDVITGVDGTFTFAFWPPPPFQFALTVTREGCGAMNGRWTTLAAGSDTNVGDVAMTAGVRVRGRVVDASGVPQAREYVTLRRRANPGSDFDRVGAGWGHQMVSRADGTFASPGWLVPGEFELRTQTFELQSQKTLTLRADRPLEEISVVVTKPAATATITGCVLDETGAPVSGVDIEERSGRGGWNTTTSGRDGTFELRRDKNDTEKATRLLALSNSYEVLEQPRDVEWGATGVELRVARAGELTLRVTDPQQHPVEIYTVRLIAQNRGRWSSMDSRARAQGKHEDGTVVIAGLTAGDWLLLVDFAASTGFMPLFLEFAHERGPRRMDLRAVPAATRTLRVVTGTDTPVAGTTVQLCDPFDTPLHDARLVMQRDHWLANASTVNALILFEGTTDAEGRVGLRGPGSRNLGVCVLGPGHVPQRQQDIRLDVTDELVVRVSRGARLTGRIVPPEALAELKRLVGADATAGFSKRNRPRVGLSDGGGRRFPADHVLASNLPGLQIADDGSFDVDGVPPGVWRVQVEAMIVNERGSGSGRTFAPGEASLTDGQTTTVDLDLICLLPGTVEGLVLLNGQPLASENVTLTADGNSVSVTTDGEGRFRKSLMAGEYKVALHRLRGNSQFVSLRCPTRVQVARDQTTAVTLVLASATLKVTVLDPEGEPVAKLGLSLVGSDQEGYFLPPTDATGTSETELTAETVTLRLLPKHLSTQAAQTKLWQEAQARGDRDPFGPHWITLQTVHLEAGRASVLELRLPASAGY